MEWFLSFLSEYKLYLLLAAGVLCGYFWLSENKKKLEINELAAFVLALLATVFGVFTLKVFAFIQDGSFSGQRLYGDIFFMPIFYWIGAKITKRKVSDVFDVFTIGTVIVFFFGRIACLFSGCCGGVCLPGSDTLRWPTVEIELVFYIVLAIVLGIRYSKPHIPGVFYPLLMISYGAFRFVLEWFREPDIVIFWKIHIAHIWSVLCFAIGLCVYLKLTYQSKHKTKRKSGVVKK